MHRIQRGFSRIGVALAIMFALLASGWGLIITFEAWARADAKQEQALCLVKASKGWERAERGPWDDYRPRDAQGLGCSGPNYRLVEKEAAEIIAAGPSADRAEVVGSLALGSIAIALGACGVWLFFHSIGWALSGFARADGG